MSQIAFGRMIFSSTENKIKAQNKNIFIDGCYMFTDNDIKETTVKVINKLYGEYDECLAKIFEISECLEGITVSELLAPKYYREKNSEWVEKEPTLLTRLGLLQKFFEKIFIEWAPKKIQFCIAGQGYPIKSDCKEKEVSVTNFATCLYNEYEQYGDTPDLLIVIK